MLESPDMKTLAKILPVLALLAVSVLATGTSSASAESHACVAQVLPQPGGHRGEQWRHPPKMTIDKFCTYRATIATTRGAIVIKLTPKAAPLAVNNFVFLATHRFYTHILFHRVIKGFMIQTGDPTCTGTGGPGYSFKIEKSGKTFPPGTVAMANTGQPNSNGRQFFICQGKQCAGLNNSSRFAPGYTIFGHVVTGMKVVDAIASVRVRANSSGEVSSPVHPVYMRSVTITEGL